MLKVGGMDFQRSLRLDVLVLYPNIITGAIFGTENTKRHDITWMASELAPILTSVFSASFAYSQLYILSRNASNEEAKTVVQGCYIARVVWLCAE